MNIIEKVTWKCMKAAKRRTMVTIFGVILSVAMIAAVSTIAQSFQDLICAMPVPISEILKWNFMMFLPNRQKSW